jgi:sugar lactone lactonase YvrE
MKTLVAECRLRAGAVLAEGPVWDLARGRLWWVDIERCELHGWDPLSGADEKWKLEHRIGFAVPSERGDLILGTQRGLARFAPETGTITPLADPESDKPDNRFNDAKCDPSGRLWAGTMGVSEEPELGRLYRVDPGSPCIVTPTVERVSISNGLAWSPDARTMYYVDSPTRRVDAFDFDMASGAIGGRRTVIEITEGFPDGMCIDAHGNLWVALWGGWGVACFDPESGKVLAKIEVPVEAVTSCCFGGPAWDELFITTASRDLDAEGRAQQPLAGGVFSVKPGVRGMATRCFGG